MDGWKKELLKRYTIGKAGRAFWGTQGYISFWEAG
jgi:hypothetical protein